jgi:hypothetical protein
MKKNFLKKLSLVLTCAMTVSVTAPAANAFAATAPALSKKAVCLYLGVKGKNSYNFNIKNNKSTYKQQWYVKDSSIVSVKKTNGVTRAKKVGLTTIGAKITNKKTGKVVKKLYGKALVRDNIASVTITNKPAGDTLKVNQENNFNRSYVTVSGSTTKTHAITRWTVDNTKTATINDKGIFKATEAGEYTVTARSFQSKAKYNKWLTNNTKYASYVTATDSYKVKVTSGMVSAVQKDVNEFKLTFDSPVTDAKSKLSVSYLLGSTKIPAQIKKVTMDADNKVATVEMYVDFNGGSTYVVDYTGMEAVQFVAATTKPEDVVSMAITTTQAQIQKDTAINVALYNKDNVNILNDDLKNRITREIVSSNNNAFLQSDDKIYMYKIGDTANIKATFHSWTYENGQEKTLNATGVVTCVKEVVDTVKAIDVYTIGKVNEAPVFYKDLKNQMALSDTNKKLYVRYTINKADGTETTEDNYSYPEKFKFTTGDTRYLQIDEDGTLYTAAVGVANVIVKYNDKTVGTVQIIIGGERQLNSIELSSNSKTSFELSNASVGDKATVEITAKDQSNTKYTNYSDASYWVNGKNGGVNVDTSTLGKYVFDATGATAGTYTFQIKIADNSSNRVLTRYSIRIKVVAPTGTVTSYALETDKDVYDMALSDRNLNEIVYAKLYGKTANKAHAEKVDLSTYNVKVTHGSKDVAYEVKDGTLEIDLTPVSNGAISKLDQGSYNIVATTGSGISKKEYKKSFTVRDNQKKPSVANNYKAYTTKTNISEQLSDCLTVTYDGRNIESEISNISYDTTSIGVVIKGFDWVQKIGENSFTHHVKGYWSIQVKY